MDLEELEKIIELMDANKLVEFEYEEEGKKIRLKREDGRPPAPVQVAMPVAAPVAQAAPPAAGAPAVPAIPDNCVEFTSPLVGTFYRAARPDADSYVNVGDAITADKVVCIIEAMKMMNEIKAEMNGTIREILVKNGQAIEFGEPLFLIEKK
jgi:acetyl-CoA carboxylase biotin carboxyl carrier protein